MLPPFAREFTKAQINQINGAHKTGGKLVIKPTQKQIDGGFLGTLASIGIPMAISLVSKMFGSGLQVDKHSSSNTANVYVPPTLGEGYPYQPPPFYGTWENPIGKGKRVRVTTRKRQPIQLDSIAGNDPLNPSLSHANHHFVIKPLSLEKITDSHFWIF